MLAKANFYFLQMRFGEKPPQHFRCVCVHCIPLPCKRHCEEEKLLFLEIKGSCVYSSSEALSVLAIIGVVYLYSLSQHRAIF